MRALDLWKTGSPAERELLRRCKNAVREIASDAELILYGSRARGDAEPESDYDLLVLLDGPAGEELQRHLSSSIYAIERVAGVVLSVQIYERDRWDSRLSRSTPLRQNVDREGVII